MDNSVDLSKIVSVIAQNPELISTVKALLSNGESTRDMPDESEQTAAAPAPASESEAVSAEAQAAMAELQLKKKRRRELLCALKPYVSVGRAKAIDSMLSFTEVLDVLKQG